MTKTLGSPHYHYFVKSKRMKKIQTANCSMKEDVLTLKIPKSPGMTSEEEINTTLKASRCSRWRLKIVSGRTEGNHYKIIKHISWKSRIHKIEPRAISELKRNSTNLWYPCNIITKWTTLMNTQRWLWIATKICKKKSKWYWRKWKWRRPTYSKWKTRFPTYKRIVSTIKEYWKAMSILT